MTSEPLSLYPRYCFDLSPTFAAWCFLKIGDTRRLSRLPEYEGKLCCASKGLYVPLSQPFTNLFTISGQNFFFYKNLPIRWVRFVGLIVSILEFPNRHIYTLDDGSGDILECILWDAELKDGSNNTHGNNETQKSQPSINWPDFGPGQLVDAKGELTWYKSTWQLRLTRIVIVPDTAAELELWDKRLAFRRDVLTVPWVLSDKEVRRARRKAEMEELNPQVDDRKDGYIKQADGLDWDEIERLLPSDATALKTAWRRVEGHKKADLVWDINVALAKRRKAERKRLKYSGLSY
ncbi:hypothetical protein Cpir12675_002192 [Ceratocystis pirilliformis]|uniref:CST complex subunit Stn1 N-terminal domain-containing protein n=1 Tax=Ceratocystis pirilliformis TaxID=259994 RepID=A0ABR3ZBY3_9PEZI